MRLSSFALVLLVSSLGSGEALASPAPVYRCVVDGVPSYLSKPANGPRCRLLAHAPPPPTPVRPVIMEDEELEKTPSRPPLPPSALPPQAEPSRPLPPLPADR